VADHNQVGFPPRILLTGGSGFLGKAIVKELLSKDSPLSPGILRIFDLKDYQGISDPRIEFRKGDIRVPEEVSEACQDTDIVIHAAAIVDWGTKPDEEIYAVNVKGTENVLLACKENHVGFLVYTSSLDAVFEGKPLVDIDETLAYPDKHPNSYCRSKFLSEKLVTQANDGQFKTCILRPSDIYGEEDPFHIGSLIDMARGGFYVRLGDGSTRSQHVFVGNIAWAHVLAVHALYTGNTIVPGNIYLITDGPPSNFFTFFDRIVKGSGYRIWPKNLWLPRWLAYSIGSISEAAALMIRPFKNYNPKFSRFAVIYTCSDFTFKTDKAFRHFNFTPKYSEEEAFERTIAGFRS
jgi:nucleoside-diphosphate-sugar epimerase